MKWREQQLQLTGVLWRNTSNAEILLAAMAPALGARVWACLWACWSFGLLGASRPPCLGWAAYTGFHLVLFLLPLPSVTLLLQYFACVSLSFTPSTSIHYIFQEFTLTITTLTLVYLHFFLVSFESRGLLYASRLFFLSWDPFGIFHIVNV